MSSVDDRIVNMQFNNKQFTQGASESEKALNNLDKTIANTAKGQGLSGLGNGITQASNKFGVLKVAGVTAVATIANKAVNAGLSLAKSLTIDPIMQGFNEYQTNLNSIQTVMANTGKGVDTVNKYMNELNAYSDKTIYNFSEMARNIGTFTAAGVKLKPATQSIKGIANLAALSGSNSQQASTAMYQLSQAISAGRVGLQDWNSVVNAGMGGAIFQKAIARTAETMGTLEKGTVRVNKETGKLTINGKTFREAMTPKPGEAPWFTSDVLTKTLQQFTGDMSDAQLASEGFSKAQIKLIQKQAEAAGQAATRIKTLPQLIDVAKESVGSGFAQIFTAVMGDFEQSGELWTKVGNKVNGVISSIFGATAKMLQGWRDLGGYDAMWEGFGNIFQALGNIIRPFVEAFKSMLPATGQAGEGLKNASFAFRDITNAIEVATRGMSALTPILVKMGEGVKFVFGLLGRGIDIVKNFFGTLDSSLSLVGGISGAFNSIGESIRSGIENGFDFSSLNGTMKVIGGKIKAALMQALNLKGSVSVSGAGDIARGLIDGIVKGFDTGNLVNKIQEIAKNIVTAFKTALGIHSPSTEMIPIGINIMQGIVEGLLAGLKFLGQAIAKGAGFLRDAFKTLFSGFDAMDYAGLINGILTAGLLVALKRATDFTGSLKNILTGVTDVLDQTGKSLKTWQNSLRAKTLLEIAAAIGIMTVSLVILSQIDPKQLAVGLGAITGMLASLSATLFAMSKIQSDFQMAVLATSLLIISAAMINLALAVTIFGRQDPVKVATGIGFMAATLGILVGSLFALSKIKGSVEGMAGTILVLSIAMNVLASAVLAFGMIPMNKLVQGLGGMAIGLGLLVGAMMLLDKMSHSVEGIAGAIFIISAAMVVLSTAVLAFGMMDMGVLAQGLGAVGIALGIMAGILLLLSGNAAGVVAAASAMAIMAVALNLLITVVLALGAAPWDVVARGLGFVALALGIFLAAAALAIPLAPGLIVLSQTMLALGAAMFLAGTGMAAFGTGFAILAATGAAGTVVLIGMIHALLAIFPAIDQQFAYALVAFLKVIANMMPKVRASLSKIFKSMVGVIIDNIPVIRRLFQTLINNAIKIISTSVPKFVEMGFKIVDSFLKSAEKHVPGITKSALSLISKFLDEIGKGIPKVVQSGVRMIVRFINGLANAINNNADDLGRAGLNLAMAIINGMTGGLLGKGTQMVKDAAQAIADKLPGWMKKVLHINSPSKRMIPIGVNVARGVAYGIAQGAINAVKAVTKLANAIVAEGNSRIRAAANSYRTEQNKAYRLQARAELKQEAAQRAAEVARKNKKNKAAQKRAKTARQEAAAARKAATNQQAKADRAKEAIDNVRAFEEADAMGKGDIKSARAVDLAERANKMLARANAEAAEGRKLMQSNAKAGRALLEQSRKDAAEARRLADLAAKANSDAAGYYNQAIDDRIQKLEDDAAFEKADTQGKADILARQAAANEARAEALRLEAASLTAQAKAKADSDYKAALALLDQAEAAAQGAADAASKAEEERNQMAQLFGQDASSPSSGGSSSITPSRSVLEDAASAVDRYTASLAYASELASTASQPIQFVQNNYSPEALSASEIYRQNKNLLSAAELKMGANR